ncbi:OmpH family outer membrane protein [Brevundimonas sp.]|jgi:outer membrane protein|uniref:OmpH family outer membrane protein n=1 Tax=Brevundimonas sp. TaxID=1871086 RepID=UPI002ED7A0FD
MKLIALGAFALAALTAGTASAQSQTPPPLTHGPVVTGVCIYSPQALLASSTAGQSLASGLQRLAQEVQGELSPYSAALETEAAALQQGGQAADPDGSRARAWQQRLQEAQQLEQTRTNELRYTERLQTQTIVTAARPIVAALYAERGCSVLLDGNTILAANPAMDITPMAVQRLNQALPSLPAFNRSPVPAELQQ